jgi:hypothetical protein
LYGLKICCASASDRYSAIAKDKGSHGHCVSLPNTVAVVSILVDRLHAGLSSEYVHFESFTMGALQLMNHAAQAIAKQHHRQMSVGDNVGGCGAAAMAAAVGAGVGFL